MKARLIVLAVFVSASAVPGLLAYSTGMFAAGATSDDGPLRASAEFRVTSLGWPGEALGLATPAQGVVWEQRSSDAAGGLWTYDVPSQQASRVLRPAELGRTAGPPSASGTTVVWTVRAADGGATRVRGFDSQTQRWFTATTHGTSAVVTGDTIAWVDTSRGRGSAHTGVAGLDAVTDARFTLDTGGRVREVVATGGRVAWLAAGTGGGVWVAERRTGRRSRLATSGTGITMDTRRLVWASHLAQGAFAVRAWNPRSRHSKELCRARGRVSGLALGNGLAVWVQDTGRGDVWAYDFNRRRAFAVCDNGAPQANAVVVGRTVFWADKRSGEWELYGRSLQP